MNNRQLAVMLFAGLAELVGHREVSLDWQGGTAADLRSALQNKYPAAASLLARSAVAVGERYCRDQDRVAVGDDVAMLPPVSGG